MRELYSDSIPQSEQVKIVFLGRPQAFNYSTGAELSTPTLQLDFGSCTIHQV